MSSNDQIEVITIAQEALKQLKQSRIKAMIRIEKLNVMIDKIEKYTDYYLDNKIDAEVLVKVIEDELLSTQKKVGE